MALVPRTWALASQVLVGDERWDLAAALARPIPALFQSFVISGANYSPPLAALLRAMLDLGPAPGELSLRMPSLLCGLATVIVLPALLVRRIGREAALGLGVLLALSPLLVLYSRLVRGYALLALLTGVAWCLFLRFEERRSRAAALGYVLASGLAVDVHLLALPFVLSPLAAAGLLGLARRAEAGPRPALLAAVAMATLFSVGLWLWPARDAIGWLLERRSAVDHPDLGVWVGAALRMAGTRSAGLALLFYLLAVCGLLVLGRRDSRLAAHAAFVIVAPTVAVAWLGPAGVDRSVLFARYVLPALPMLLVLVAVGLGPPGPRARRLFAPWTGRAGALASARVVQVACAVVFVGVLVATGPLVGPAFRDASFANALAFEDWARDPPAPAALESADFLRTLAEPGRAGAVVETLWHGVLFPDVARAEARLHRQPVIVASLLDRWWADARLALRFAGDPDPQALLAGEGRWLVVHRRPVEEALLVHDRDAATRRLFATLGGFAQSYERASRAAARRYAHAFGPADHTDAWLSVWDLARLRSAHGGAAGGGAAGGGAAGGGAAGKEGQPSGLKSPG